MNDIAFFALQRAFRYASRSMRILVLQGAQDQAESNAPLAAAAKELGVELAISRAADEPGVRAAVAQNIGRVQGVLISAALCRPPYALHDALRTMHVPVVEILRSNTLALRSMVEMLR